MIRDFKYEDMIYVNKLLEELNYELKEESFNNDFLRVIVYDDGIIKGVLVYQDLIDIITIDYIAVDKNFRRNGIATELIKYMELNNPNILNTTLEVNENNIGAIEFYKNNGFRKAAIRKNYYNTENGILMIKEYR